MCWCIVCVLNGREGLGCGVRVHDSCAGCMTHAASAPRHAHGPTPPPTATLPPHPPRSDQQARDGETMQQLPGPAPSPQLSALLARYGLQPATHMGGPSGALLAVSLAAADGCCGGIHGPLPPPGCSWHAGCCGHAGCWRMRVAAGMRVGMCAGWRLRAGVQRGMYCGA